VRRERGREGARREHGCVPPSALVPRVVSYNPARVALLEDPNPEYARLREAGPLCRAGPGQWAVTHHRHVGSLLRDRRLGNCFPEVYRRFVFGDTEVGSFFGNVLLNRDPPDHTRLRRLLAGAMGPGMIANIGARIDVLVDDLLAPVLEQSEFDAVAALALPLPATVMCELVGIPAAETWSMRRSGAAPIMLTDELPAMGTTSAKPCAAHRFMCTFMLPTPLRKVSWPLGWVPRNCSCS
jgi:cytochrome P450